MNSRELRESLVRLSALLELDGAPKGRTKALGACIEALDEQTEGFESLEGPAWKAFVKARSEEVHGILESFAQRGRTDEFNALQAKYPIGLAQIVQLQGLGAAKTLKLYHDLDVRDLEGLIRIAENGTLLQVKGYGQKSVEKLLAAAKALLSGGEVAEEDVDDVEEVEEVEAAAEVEEVEAAAEVEAADEVEAAAEVEAADEVEEVEAAAEVEEVEAAAEVEEVEAAAEVEEVEAAAEVEEVEEVEAAAEVEATAEVEEPDEDDEDDEDDLEKEEVRVHSVKVVRRGVDDDFDVSFAPQPHPVMPGLDASDMGVGAVLRCPTCQQIGFDLGSTFAHCQHCSATYSVKDGVVDMVGSLVCPRSLSQRAMESAIYPKVYEKWVRPTFTSVLADRTVEAELGLALDLLDLHELEPGDKVLDAACGTGLFSRRFAGALKTKDTVVVGLDLSKTMIREAAKLSLGLSNLHFVRGDALSAPFAPHSFKRIHCAGSFHLIADREKLLRELHRLLAPGGIVVLSTFTMAHGVLRRFAFALGAKVIGMHSFDPDDLHDMVEHAGFSVVTQSRQREAITLKLTT